MSRQGVGMSVRRGFVAAVAVAAALSLASCVAQQTATLSAGAAGAAGVAAINLKPVPAEVLLIRGGANIFSTGLDTIAEKLRAKGVDARSVGYIGWPALVNELDERYAKESIRIVLIGHSFGANTAAIMAQKMLERRTPVALIVLYDPTESQRIAPNVDHVLYFSSRTASGTGISVTGLYGFKGSIETINVPENHLGMDESGLLQDQTVAAVLAALGPGNVAATQ